MARKTKEEAEKTRQRILDAALKVFSEKGYSKATFVDVASEIGLTKGAVYWHFKTKPELLAAVVAYGEEKQCARYKDAMPETLAELRDTVVELVTAIADDDESWKFEFFCGFQIEWSAELMAEVHERLAALRGDPLKLFEQKLLHLQENGALSKKRDARDLALCFASSWVGAMNLTMYAEYDRKKYVEVLIASFDLLFSSLSG
ncbi:TetR family transcriptional regulator [Pontiella sulfatireligans]|uniref:HTH-type transcriptional regulator SrpR n=1 Tax=Pontiella sulfatireligans TaxID=2750658 RepID=A0A6C2UK69_9BACT|nr:TetR family transcriptional regulator [Pontiella sulfatireligans]VGO20273.1 HTH-type transcriptional regulator SrpR [Pontiella sulfatireligans]